MGKETLSRRIRLKNIVLPVVVIGLIIIQFYSSDRAWDILLVAFGGEFLLSAVWAFSLLWGLAFKREPQQGWAQVGDRFIEQFTITRKSPFPVLAATILDHSDFPGHNSNAAWPVIGDSERVWFMDNVFYKRGLYTLGPTEIRVADPFGVFEVTFQHSHTREILITPPIITLQQIDIASGDWHGDSGARSRSFERTVTAASVRQYTTGDSLFSIHWLTSARLDDYFVRKFDRQPSSDWWILLDMDRFVQLGEGLEATEEYAALLAASIADRGLKENRAVGIIAEGRKKLWLPPKTGSGQTAEILHSLALLEQGTTPLKDLLSQTQRYLGRKSSAIIITPSADPAWLGALAALKQRGVSTTVLLLDRADFGAARSSSPVLSQLSTWGIRCYLIGRNIYTQPEFREFYPRLTRGSPFFSINSTRETK